MRSSVQPAHHEIEAMSFVIVYASLRCCASLLLLHGLR